ncbi:hypothetical protein BV898_00349 [Hypsibius exemplaris]|uniref:Uncharacterized protein n=1 Tax=Hypsibius exemplaris TaxID=2072580 RepID=A0A1W0XFV1_HYPEX|nr:hypothetical protein BV898_00349 [Hypsibius exemplaris]
MDADKNHGHDLANIGSGSGSNAPTENQPSAGDKDNTTVNAGDGGPGSHGFFAGDGAREDSTEKPEQWKKKVVKGASWAETVEAEGVADPAHRTMSRAKHQAKVALVAALE